MNGIEDFEVRIEEHPEKPARTRKAAATPVRRRGRGTTSTGVSDEASATPPDPEAFERLRAWRLDVARSENVPAFRILPDRVLRRIAADKPRTPDALLAVPGIHPRFVQKWGRDLLLALGNP